MRVVEGLLIRGGPVAAFATLFVATRFVCGVKGGAEVGGGGPVAGRFLDKFVRGGGDLRGCIVEHGSSWGEDGGGVGGKALDGGAVEVEADAGAVRAVVVVLGVEEIGPRVVRVAVSDAALSEGACFGPVPVEGNKTGGVVDDRDGGVVDERDEGGLPVMLELSFGGWQVRVSGGGRALTACFGESGGEGVGAGLEGGDVRSFLAEIAVAWWGIVVAGDAALLAAKVGRDNGVRVRGKRAVGVVAWAE
jgi:hypothetical protein